MPLVIRACFRLLLLAAWSLVATPVALLVGLAALVRPEIAARIGPSLLALFAQGVLLILGIRPKVEGERPRPGSFAAPNHWGYVDVFVLGALYRSLFVSRADVAHWPVLGPFSRVAGTLFIERSRRRDAARVGSEIERHLRLGRCVTAFLEGGSGRGDVVRPFKPPLLEAAAASGAPCVPVAIRYRLPRDPGSDPSECVAWVGEVTFTRHVWRLLHLRRIEAHVRFGAPRTGGDRKALARQLEEDVRAALA